MAEGQRDRRLESVRRSSPQTDPTNPFRLESTGRPASERESERRQDEPGLTDRDRQERDAY